MFVELWQLFPDQRLERLVRVAHTGFPVAIKDAKRIMLEEYMHPFKGILEAFQSTQLE